MYTANIKLKLGKNTKDYFQILDKNITYKRSRLKIKATDEALNVDIEADDPVALIASTNSIIRQLRIIGNAENLFDD